MNWKTIRKSLWILVILVQIVSWVVIGLLTISEKSTKKQEKHFTTEDIRVVSRLAFRCGYYTATVNDATNIKSNNSKAIFEDNNFTKDSLWFERTKISLLIKE